MSPEIAEIYGNKVRIRVCGLCWQDDRLLMVKHNMGDQDFWAPPGGGVEFGEPLAGTLTREIMEECGIQVIPGKFLFGCELIRNPLHAVELFFEVQPISGIIKPGQDPELELIETVQFLSPLEIEKIPPADLHGIFRIAGHVNNLRHLTGFYRI